MNTHVSGKLMPLVTFFVLFITGIVRPVSAVETGQDIDFVYQAYLSPQQEPKEESQTPANTPQELRSTAPSVDRDQRKSSGHGTIRFSNDLGKAFVDVAVANLNADDVVMFHIHCDRPDMLGPILIDFANSVDLKQDLADGTMSVELTHKDLEKVLDAAKGSDLTGQYTLGCPTVPGIKGKVRTIAGMEHIARQGELYFNLHTKGQTYFGEMRGQVRPTSANYQ